MSMAGTTITASIAVSGQSATAQKILNFVGRKIRLTVKSDSYRDQCYAEAALWDGNRWNEVYRIHPANMITKSSLAYGRQPPGWDAFNEDLTDLFAVTAAIIQEGP